MTNKTEEQPGTCLYMDAEGSISGKLDDKTLFSTIIKDMAEVRDNRVSLTKVYRSDDELTGFVELLEPAVTLVVAGAGNDAIPLTELAAVLGWGVTLVDGRANYATKDRFPHAKTIIKGKPDQVTGQLEPDDRTAFIMMTHNYNYDLAMLKCLISKPVKYLGMLGPRKRTEKMLNELKEENIILKEEQLQRIYGPAGLDLGAETPEDIALSVISEIKTVLADKPASHLRDKEEPIHARDSEVLIR